LADHNVRIENDYQCIGTFSTAYSGAIYDGSRYVVLPKNSAENDTGDNGHPVAFTTRIRHEIEAFGVTDVSDWVTKPVTVRIADDETAYDACGGGAGGGGGDGGGDPDPEGT